MVAAGFFGDDGFRLATHGADDGGAKPLRPVAEDYKLRLATLLPTLNDPAASAIAPTPTTPAPELQPVR
ncbi:MAG: hypothetical protein K2X09_01080, partial [Rickettsiales bacterium]|nr:hypothetical protein [Rickettsiales bacterium]